MRSNITTCIVVNWNYGMFLRECLDSIINQTVQPQRIIIADDASTDSSHGIIAEYAERYPGFIVPIINLMRVGTIANENAAAELVDTKYMFYMDADDTAEPTYLEKCERVIMNANDDKLAIVYSDMMKFGDWSGLWAVIDWDPISLRQGNYINGHSVVLKKAFDSVGGLRDTGGFEDHQLWVDLIDKDPSYYGVHIPEPLINYRRHRFGHRTGNTDINTRS